jgi:hypothetical protein
MKKKTIYASIIIISAILILSSVLLFKSKEGTISPDSPSCIKDTDCIKVQTSCCSCNMGGEEKCILISEKQKYNEMLEKCTARTICTAMYACREFSCKCVQGKCVEETRI